MKGVLKKLVSGKKLARKMLFFPIYLYLAYHKYIYIYSFWYIWDRSDTTRYKIYI